MSHVFAFTNLVVSVAFFALLAVKLWAFVDALTRPAEAFVAAGKMTKPGWLIILGIAVALTLLSGNVLGLFSIIGIIAAFVYLLDVRPALSSITRRR